MKKIPRVIFAALAAAFWVPPANAAVKLSSPDGIYHSAHPDFGVADDIVSAQNVIDFERLAGKKIVWAYISWNWGTAVTATSMANETSPTAPRDSGTRTAK